MGSAVGGALHKVSNIAGMITPDARLADDTLVTDAIKNIQAQRQKLNEQATAQGTFINKAQNYNTSALDVLQGAASGNAPSQAQGVLQKGLDQSIASQYALGQSGNVSQQIAGQKQAQSNIAQLQQQTANDASMLRAQEMAAARQDFAAQAGQNVGQQQNYMNALNSQIGISTGQEVGAASGKYNADTAANSEANKAIQANNPMGAIAGVASKAVGSIAPVLATALSSKDYKEDKKEIKEDKALKAILNMPIEKWKYKKGIADESEHIGPYAEDFKKETGMGSGKEISVQDSIGLIMKSIQDLNAKIDNIKGK
jgi:uncharacterized protein YfiM (DUF2279 family)